MTEFSKIYDEYFQYVYKYTLSLCQDVAVAEDITQETFFKVLKVIYFTINLVVYETRPCFQ